MRIKEAIDKIKNKLKTTFPEFCVDDYNNDFDKLLFTAPKGCLLVRYDDSEFSKPETTDKILQSERMKFVVFTGLRYCKNYSESYDILDDIKDCLLGLKIQDRKLYLKNRQYIKKIKADYWWAYTLYLDVISEQTQNLPDFSIINHNVWAGEFTKVHTEGLLA